MKNEKIPAITWWILIGGVLVAIYLFNNNSSSSTTNQNTDTTQPSVVQTPPTSNSVEKVALKQKCAEDGKQFAQNYQQAGTAGTQAQTIWFDPQYHFDTKLNTCLTYVSYNYVDSQPTIDETLSGNSTETITNYNTVYDIYSNKALLQSDITKTYTTVNNNQTESDTVDSITLSQDVPNSDANTFSNQLKVLMNE